jgi:predicted alpha/beta hydrolase
MQVLLKWAQLDMTAVFDWVIDNYPNHKKVLFGHSMGGQLVGLMENNKQIDHLFLVASFLVRKHEIKNQ